MKRAVSLIVILLAACGTRGGSTPFRPDAGHDMNIVLTCDSEVDSDSDGLFDALEGMSDIDGDGMVNSQDQDSDGDGLLDAEESGAIGGCSARNSDDDGIADYLDNDSDNDGLSDREESERYHTNPTAADSDGDGFSDAAEVATGHDPLLDTDGIPPEAFYLVLPYGGVPQERDLSFSTNIRQADVFFMMDRTGSMSGATTQLRDGLSELVTRLAVAIPDIGVGVGGFADFPVGNCMDLLGITSCDYGGAEDLPFTLISTITTDRAQILEDVSMLHADLGGVRWASSAEALFQAATGAGIGPWVAPQVCVSAPDDIGPHVGYPCFRPGSLPIIVVMTDTSSRSGPFVASEDMYDSGEFMGTPPHAYEETVAALRNIGARAFGVVNGTEVDAPTSEAQFKEWARATGTVDAAGEPIFFSIPSNGSGLTDRVGEAIESLVSGTPQDVGTRVRDGEDFPEGIGPVDAATFVKLIVPTIARREGVEIDSTMIPRDDVTFYGVPPGVEVSFHLTFQNDSVPSLNVSQIFRATIVVVGNGVAELDTRDVIIVVPAGSVPLF